MWYKLKSDNFSYIQSIEQITDEFKFMDDNLFEEGFGGNIILKSLIENPTAEYLAAKQKYDNEQTIQECQAYLDETDYVITKLNELKLEDEDEYETEKTKYAEVLTKRKECRKKINELQEGE